MSYQTLGLRTVAKWDAISGSARAGLKRSRSSGQMVRAAWWVNRRQRGSLSALNLQGALM